MAGFAATFFKALTGKSYRFHHLEEVQGVLGNERASTTRIRKE